MEPKDNDTFLKKAILSEFCGEQVVDMGGGGGVKLAARIASTIKNKYNSCFSKRGFF
jgi:hypothetical protein